jgi:pyrroloquinoline quinone (PQQ) biosynthesis protein C
MLPNYKSSVASMSEVIRTFPWDNKYAYAQFLAQTYYYISHSTRLLAASAARFSQADQSMHKRFLKHTDEENSHELLALRDLQKLGFKIQDFPELPQTKTLYEIQYCKIEHCDPAALMGYILALETMAGHDFSWLKEKATGLYGKECAKFIQVHADEDPDHIEKALKVIQGLSSERLDLIDMNIEQTALCYGDMLNACKARALKQTIRKAA